MDIKKRKQQRSVSMLRLGVIDMQMRRRCVYIYTWPALLSTGILFLFHTSGLGHIYISTWRELIRRMIIELLIISLFK